MVSAFQTTSILSLRSSEIFNICSLTISTDYPDGSHETFEYDRLNRLTAHIDGLGAKTAYELAMDGLPLKRTNALGHTRLSGSQIRRLEAGGRFPNGWPTTCKPKAKTHTMP